MKFVFKDTADYQELTLPVTPASFETGSGIRVETINIHTMGDVNLAGKGSLATIKINCMFPANRYPFAVTGDVQPYMLVAQFQDWIEKGAILRFIVTDTPVNLPVLVESITYGERDGTGDVYAELVLREYRYLRLPTYYYTGSGTLITSDSRAVEAEPETPESYIVQAGDTLSGICYKYYGDASFYPQVADRSGIKNPHLIYPGDVVLLPPRESLKGV